jgi:adenosylmethionine-8-amino-7-oxononanoate aminotransferase
MKGKNNIWHPYTQAKIAPAELPVKTAKDSKLILEDGSELIDGISSWWSVCHGYQHPYLIEKMQAQLETLSHVMFAGISHEPAYTLAARLAKLTPEGLARVFFADSGSVAVEVAMKMAVQFFSNQGQRRRNKFVSFRDSYHGDTMGALSLNDPESWISKAFNHYAPMQYVVEIPHDEYGFAEFDALLAAEKNNIAGVIIEPLVQGAGGFKFHSADILAEIYRITKKNDILFIADEIMTGFYRTGNIFAVSEAGITPDIMCVGKALTGGMISLAATIATEEIYNQFLSDSIDKAFLHGPTFMANPLACAAANASLDLFERENFQEKIEKIENFLNENLLPLKSNKFVKDIRVKGAIGVIEINKPEKYNNIWDFMFELRQTYAKNGVWLRPFKDVIYIMPNFNMSEKDLKKIISEIEKSLV